MVLLAWLACAKAPRVEVPEPAWRVHPVEVLSGDPVQIVLVGLPPNTRVTLGASRPWGFGQWRVVHRSSAVFEVGDDGRIDLARDAPVEGTWSQADPRGLFWSMARTSEPAVGARTDLVVLTADLDDDGAPDLEHTVTLLAQAADLWEASLEGHPGAFVMGLPNDPEAEPRPAIVLLGGSEGNDWSARTIGPALASRGYIVVGVPYYSPPAYGQAPQFPALPDAYAEIPLDRISDVRAQVGARSDVRADAIAVWGMSKGAEMALAHAALDPGWAAIAAISPSSVVWEGFTGWQDGARPSATSSYTWRGTALPFVPTALLGDVVEALGLEGPARMRQSTRAARDQHPEVFAAAAIDVAGIDAPVLVVGGLLDEMCDCGGMAQQIRDAREQAGKPTVAYIGPDASHRISGDGYAPATAGNAALMGQAWPGLLAFFDTHLNRPATER